MEWTLYNIVQLVFFTIVLNKCSDRQRCHLLANASEFGDDPCPTTSKYLEVAYKCRPNEFRSRVACEGDELRLRCQKRGTRLAIYSAMFGRSQQGNIECPARPGQEQDCDSECAMDTVLQMCHGKKKCKVEASENVFGNPCRLGTEKYLAVVYTCVPRRILREMTDNVDAYPETFCGADGTISPDLIAATPSPLPISPDGGGGAGGSRGEPDESFFPSPDGGLGGVQPGYLPEPSTYNYNFPPPSSSPDPWEGVVYPDHVPKSEGEIVIVDTGPGDTLPETPSVGEAEDSPTKGFIYDWFFTWNYIQENKEKFTLYLLLGLCVGIILILLVIIIRLCMLRKKKHTKAKLEISGPITNSTVSHQTPESTALLDKTDTTDGIEMLSYNQSGSLHRPAPPGSFTGSLSRPGHNSGPWSNEYRTDVANRSSHINNYYGS